MDNVTFIPYQDKADLNYSLNAGDIHWCVNAKGIKGVSCPSKYYGLAAAGKPVLGVLEHDSEIQRIIERSGNGLCCEPEDYECIEKMISWFIEKSGTEELTDIGRKGRAYLEKNLTKDVSIKKYTEEILNC